MNENVYVLRVGFNYDIAFKNLDQDDETIEHLEDLMNYIENDLYENGPIFNTFNFDMQDGFDIVSYPDTLENIQLLKKHLHDQDGPYYKRLKIENTYNL